MNLSEGLDAGLILFAYDVFSDPMMARPQGQVQDFLQIYLCTGVQIRRWDRCYEEYPGAPQLERCLVLRFFTISNGFLYFT